MKEKRAEQVHGVKIGSIVKTDFYTYRVTRVEIDFGFEKEKPWVRGQKQKKDGTFTDQSYSVYRDWEVVNN